LVLVTQEINITKSYIERTMNKIEKIEKKIGETLKSGKKDLDYDELNSDFSDIEEQDELNQQNLKLNDGNFENGTKELIERNKFLRR